MRVRARVRDGVGAGVGVGAARRARARARPPIPMRARPLPRHTRRCFGKAEKTVWCVPALRVPLVHSQINHLALSAKNPVLRGGISVIIL